jgi:hypothetical protein
MASNINVSLLGALWQVIDNSVALARVNSSIGTVTLAASEATHIDYLPIAGGGTVLTLPAATIWVLAIRNLGGTNATPAGNITVQAQPTGGALPSAVNSPQVVPGGVYIYWNAAETAGGLIAVTLVASVANTPVEILMAA